MRFSTFAPGSCMPPLGSQGVEDDHMNILCVGGRTMGPAVAWDLVVTFLEAEFSQAPRHLRRLAKVASLEPQGVSP
jgi:ribose 5-phosphate isomerase B